MRMTDRFDIVVAGAGHNSLVAAAYLAKAGYRCLVLEGRSVLGGNVVTEELTLPGFRHDSCGTAHVILQDSPMMRNDELGLADYGLEYIHPEIVCHAPFLDGSWLTQYHDIERVIELDFVRATEHAALNSIQWLGRGEKELADAAACDAIRGMFDLMNICGEVVIGEGIKDNAPGIFKGEHLGTWTPGSSRFSRSSNASAWSLGAP